jgi:parvulin-like peptidyl-prolyl isomerase
MPARRTRKNRNFMKSIQGPVVWAIAILFGVGIIWWSVAQYLGGDSRNDPQSGSVDLQFSETAGGLTKDGTPMSDQRYWVTYSEYETSVRDTLTNLRSQGYSLDPYFEIDNNPSEMGIRYEIFKSLFEQKVLLYYATENDVVPSQEAIKAETDRIVNQYTSDENTKSSIIYQYGSVDAFSKLVGNYVATQLLAMNVRDKAIPDIDRLFEAFVTENLADLKYRYEKVDASHILVTEAASALEIKTLIETGEMEFSKAASEFSIDTGTASIGGSLGMFGRGQMVMEFEEASFSATPGLIVGPVKSQFGYHLIKVDSKLAFDNYEEFKTITEFETERTQFEDNQFEIWLNKLKDEQRLSYIINDPDLKMYDAYEMSKNNPEKSKAFIENIQRDYFDSEGNILLGDSYLPIVLYTGLADSRISTLSSQVLDLEELKDIFETLPATISTLAATEVASMLETTPATDLEMRAHLNNARIMQDYLDRYDLASPAEVDQMLIPLSDTFSTLNKYFESSVRFLYSIMPNSTQVINYMYRIDGSNPQIVYMYNENLYNRNVRPLLENPALLDSYLQYYGQFFGPQAVSFLIDSPVQSIESDLNRKILSREDVPVDVKVSTLYLLVDIYEKLANVQTDNLMMQMYLMGQKNYLEMLQALYPEDAAIKTMIETVVFQISELEIRESPEATETVD